MPDTHQDFKCKRCGHCCLNLPGAYQNVAQGDDIDRWRSEGREDILCRIDISHLKRGDIDENDFWLNEAGDALVDRCPFLRKFPNQHKYKCLIHATRPFHCRHYPDSETYAKACGCPGFDK